MSELWSPTFWSGLSGPGIAILVCAAFVWALVTERLVIGKQYRAAVARAETAEATNAKLTGSLMEKNAAEEMATKLLAAMRTTADSAKDLN